MFLLFYVHLELAMLFSSKGWHVTEIKKSDSYSYAVFFFRRILLILKNIYGMKPLEKLKEPQNP